ncbi:MAG TPA: hypothetical protein DCX27_08100, partial [Balneola sp.]|nr:hypothetical protein [Balneola sp.]
MPKKKRGSKPKQESNDDGYPKVSILTPLYNRNKWLPLMMANVCHFNYDKKKLEWFILDSKDGDEDVRLFKNETEVEMIRNVIRPIKLKYVYINRKMTIAEKRTYLTKNMSHPWFANLDSDDMYFDQYLKYSIDLCRKNKVQLCGSPQMIFCWVHRDYEISAIECSAVRQCHEATMVGTKKYVASMNYYTKNDEKGEGSSLIDGNENNVTKSQCKECMMCICHNKNTCNKDTFIGANVQDFKATGTKIEILKEIMKEEVA